MLLASTAGTDIASFNPATLTFTALAPTGKADSNDQENWNILPNGKVLTVDSRTASRFGNLQRATNAWVPRRRNASKPGGRRHQYKLQRGWTGGLAA